MRYEHAGYIRMAAMLHDSELIGAWEAATKIMGRRLASGEFEAYEGLQDWRQALEKEWNGRTELCPIFQPRA